MFDPGFTLSSIFTIDQPILETVLRGSATYLAILVLFRTMLKREGASFGKADFLLIVLIADAAQNAMAGGYDSIGSGLLLIFTLIFWNLVLDFLGSRYQLMERLLHPPPLPAIKDGKILMHNLRHEMVSRSELMAWLRQEGITDLNEVQEATIEADGSVSIMRRPGAKQQGQ